MRNAMTVDVEDYFHVTALSSRIRRRDWDNCECRVEANTHRLLDLFSETGVTATFFVLGWVADRYPQLVREIAARGHELASHGQSHQLVYRQSRAQFREETIRARSTLQDLVQQPIDGYRAASYSITSASLWALDVLVEAGFRWDSSIFPVRHDHYGMPDAPRWPYKLRTPSGHILTEFPLSTWPLFGYRLPVAGGGYFRLYPYRFSEFALSRINREGRPFIFYIHPWEVDPGQPRVKVGPLSSFRHYNNLDLCEQRLRRLVQRFRFGSVAQVLRDLAISHEQPVAVASA